MPDWRICRGWVWVALALPGLLPPSSHAQYQDASAAGGPVDITAEWRFHTSDDARWAQPDFDDSHWPLLKAQGGWNTQGYANYAGYAWYRIRLELPDAQKPLGISFGPIFSAADVFVDGQRLATFGQMRPRPTDIYQDAEYVVALPGLAIRVWHGTNSPRGNAAGLNRDPQVGDLATLEMEQQLDHAAEIVSSLPKILLGVVALGIGLFSLGLFLLRPSEREYRWAALWLLGWSCIYLLAPSASGNAGGSLHSSSNWSLIRTRLWVELVLAVADASYLMFVWNFVRAKPDLLLKIGLTAVALEYVNAVLFTC
jgi:hypothetical protein